LQTAELHQLLTERTRDANLARADRARSIRVEQADPAVGAAPARQLELRLAVAVRDRIQQQDARKFADTPRGFGGGVNGECLSDKSKLSGWW